VGRGTEADQRDPPARMLEIRIIPFEAFGAGDTGHLECGGVD